MFMKLVLDHFINIELKEFLLTQEGITKVNLRENNNFTVLDIKYNEKVTPYIIMKYIELFQNTKNSILFEFDKETKGNYKVLKYTVSDMCCEYCYKNLIMDLFEMQEVKSARSNFDDNKPPFNIEFIIEIDEKYPQEKVIKYIEENYN